MSRRPKTAKTNLGRNSRVLNSRAPLAPYKTSHPEYLKTVVLIDERAYILGGSLGRRR